MWSYSAPEQAFHRMNLSRYVNGEVVAYRKLPTDPDSPDTDGDGREACGKRTDPTSADTDSDGLTDYEEVYSFNYDNATSSPANVTVNVTVDAAGEYTWKIKTSATAVSGSDVKAVAYLDGQLKWSRNSLTGWTNFEVTFDAILPKGLHSLQVQKASATGTVTLKLVNVTKPSSLFTNALYPDTDKDWLSDGDELLGRTGWMTSPTKGDTDGDGASDGREIRTLHSDPLLRDTDHDTFADGIDLDPLYDVVVQLRVGRMSVTDNTADDMQYYARATVGPNWTNSVSIGEGGFTDVDHVLSVNVRDSAAASVKIQVFRNDGTEIDVSPQVGVKAFTTSVNLRDPDLYGGQTVGDETSAWANVRYDLRVIRVGKANTLLMVPNDWSTLSNGTVDGRPTGLHRYVGEQRFVFGLLNVTDGRGDLVSYDLETRKTLAQPFYVDDSGNGLVGSFAGASLVPGYFGSGTRLSGSGSYVTATEDAELNWIDGSFTVAFWVRPETDYVNGTGWAWSFGRKDLWRLGFEGGSTNGMRFDVWDAGGGLHTAQAVHPLYAGRWVHLAATMAQSGIFTRLTVYANGNAVAWRNDTSLYQVKDGLSNLSLGWDEAAGPSAGRFRGIVDEFRLYRTALSQDAIKGLLWFLHGANNVILPRGVFYESTLYGKLNETSLDTGAPFAGGTAYGNSNTLSSNLNSRVIQMVLTKNLTLAQAWGDPRPREDELDGQRHRLTVGVNGGSYIAAPYLLPMRFKVHLQKDEDGVWVATVPALPGCISQGRTPAEARKNIREAISLHVSSLAEDGIPIRKRRGVIETVVAVRA